MPTEGPPNPYSIQTYFFLYFHPWSLVLTICSMLMETQRLCHFPSLFQGSFPPLTLLRGGYWQGQGSMAYQERVVKNILLTTPLHTQEKEYLIIHV